MHPPLKPLRLFFAVRSQGKIRPSGILARHSPGRLAVSYQIDIIFKFGQEIHHLM